MRVLPGVFMAMGVALCGCGGSQVSTNAMASPAPKTFVYTISNDGMANEVLRSERNADGTLLPPVSYPTHGTGSGGSLENQGALAMSDDGKLLFAVNPGSNNFTIFSVQDSSLIFVSITSSGGIRPTSVTSRGRMVYVLNSVSNDISGYLLNANNDSVPIPNGRLPLSDPGASPSQISFDNTGSFIIVTDRATASIEIFPVDSSGTPSTSHVNHSSGAGPFGFAFDGNGRLYVSEVQTNALSSYTIESNATLLAVTSSLRNNQSGVCWTVVTPDGRFAFTANTGSHTVTAYRISADGSLGLLSASGNSASTSGGAFDLTVSADGRFLYVLSGRQSIDVFSIAPDGGLSAVQTLTGLPSASNGLITR